MSLQDLIAARQKGSSASLEEPPTTPLSQGTVTSGEYPEGESAAKSSVAAVAAGGSSNEDPRPSSEADEKGTAEAAAPTAQVAEDEPQQGQGVAAESQIPRGVNEVVTPSGIQIYYQAAPKRLYKVQGKEVPSVTNVLDCLNKQGLPWWGMKVGIEGTIDLLETEDWLKEPWSVDFVVERLTELKKTVNHVRDQAGDRGQAVHDALEAWAEQGVMPEPDVYGPEERGYVSALRDFLVDSGAEAVASEVMVGSAKHKYAGRYDLVARIPDGAEVIVKTYPKRQPVWEHLVGGRYLLDLKTSKQAYKTHALQLAAYETASIECGYDPTMQQGIIHVTEDGRYELVRSKATTADFKAILSAHKVMQKDLLY